MRILDPAVTRGLSTGPEKPAPALTPLDMRWGRWRCPNHPGLSWREHPTAHRIGAAVLWSEPGNLGPERPPRPRRVETRVGVCGVCAIIPRISAPMLSRKKSLRRSEVGSVAAALAAEVAHNRHCVLLKGPSATPASPSLVQADSNRSTSSHTSRSPGG
jgi:hypothetical protein